MTGVFDDETAKWLTGLDEDMYDKLTAVWLVAFFGKDRALWEITLEMQTNRG